MVSHGPKASATRLLETSTGRNGFIAWTYHGHMPRPRVLLLDVNETLLDLTPLRQTVAAALGSREDLASLWFSATLHYSLVATVTDAYRNLDAIAAAALRMVAAGADIDLSPSEAEASLAPIRSLPPYPDVADALPRLRAAGYVLAALTNSPEETLQEQLDWAGIGRHFHHRFSVETLAMYKPHSHVYRWAASRVGAEADECMMVAAHAWDVAGAARAGLRTAFIARPGKTLFDLAPPVDVRAGSLTALADSLLDDQRSAL